MYNFSKSYLFFIFSEARLRVSVLLFIKILGNFLNKSGGCGFFKWHDPCFTERARELLIRFRDCERSLLEENLVLSRENEFLKINLQNPTIMQPEVGSAGGVRRSTRRSGRSHGAFSEPTVNVDRAVDEEASHNPHNVRNDNQLTHALMFEEIGGQAAFYKKCCWVLGFMIIMIK